MVLTCEDCLSDAAAELALCPNCGGENLRPATDEDTAARKAKGEALGVAQDYSRLATAERKGYEKRDSGQKASS